MKTYEQFIISDKLDLIKLKDYYKKYKFILYILIKNKYYYEIPQNF